MSLLFLELVEFVPDWAGSFAFLFCDSLAGWVTFGAPCWTIQFWQGPSMFIILYALTTDHACDTCPADDRVMQAGPNIQTPTLFTILSQSGTGSRPILNDRGGLKWTSENGGIA